MDGQGAVVSFAWGVAEDMGGVEVPALVHGVGIGSFSCCLELLKCLGSFEIEKLILDPCGKVPVEFTLKHNIIPSGVGSMLRELNQILVNVVILLHLE